MKIIQGKGIGSGVAIGPIVFLDSEKKAADYKIVDTEAEISRYEHAKEEAILQLNELREKTENKAGSENSKIFEIHVMLLEDDDYRDSVYEKISNGHWNAEYAVLQTGEQMGEAFKVMEDEYFRSRAIDLKDISRRMASILRGNTPEDILNGRSGIVAAQELTPSQTVQMDKTCLKGFVTHEGSASSHTAILARAMAIPAVAGITPDPEWDGKTAILDGGSGCLILEPDEATIHAYEQKTQKGYEERLLLQDLIGKKNISCSGKTIDIFANVGSLEDVVTARENDAGGVGLFRTEFLYLNSDTLPTEEQQFQIYKNAILQMEGKKVIFRTIDIGADKQVPYLRQEKEENPAMGCRGIRLCLKYRDIFITQLRAMYRASAFGCMAIMFPMISSEEEIDAALAIARQVKDELRKEKLPFCEDAEEGIMIETPAAGIISDRLAQKVDFFSIGTNDLTQYTLAVDRQNAALNEYYKPHHEAILRLIQLTVENAHRAGIWVGICGELGADTTLTGRFLAMGVDELSVSPLAVLKIRQAVRTSE